MTDEPPYQTPLDRRLDWVANKSGLCATAEHWSVLFTGVLMPASGCACCLLFRGIGLGFFVGAWLGAVLGAVVMLLKLT